jgi:hypothetical protein
MSDAVRRSMAVVAALALGCVAGVAPVLAHHSFAAEYDQDKPLNLTGTVTSMKWSNPHGWLYLDIAGSDGNVVNWAFELAATNALIRSGWKKEDVPPGTRLRVEGFQARHNPAVAFAAKIWFADGRPLFQGSPTAAGAPR